MIGEEEKVEVMKKCIDRALYNGCGTQMMVVVAFIVVLFFSSCATRTKIEYRDRVVDHYITKVEKDTFVEKMHDSVYVNVYTRGDTVFQEKYIEKTKWKDRIVFKHDTCRVDSIITIRKEVTKEVIKYPKTYWYAVGISVLFFILAFRKLLKFIKVF